MKLRIHALAGCLAADKLYILVVYKIVKHSHRITSAAYACNYCRRELSFLFEYLLARFLAYYTLEISYNSRERVRAHYRAEHVQRVVNSIRPFSHSLVYCILKRHSSRSNGVYLRSEELHPVDVERLSFCVLFSHEYLALKAEQRCCCSRCYAVLSCACFCDNSRLAHLLCEEHLTEYVIYLVRSCMIQILALEIYLCAAEVLRHLFCVIKQ